MKNVILRETMTNTIILVDDNWLLHNIWIWFFKIEVKLGKVSM